MAPVFTDRFFNTAGPVRADWHYLIDPLTRWNMDDILQLIAQGKYFVLHAPRQTGKTSCLLALMEYLNAEGRYQAVYANIETAQTARNDVFRGIDTVVHTLASMAQLYQQDARLHDWRQAMLKQSAPADDMLRSLLSQWAAQTDQPIVLFLDEVDALVGDTLVSLLRQLRAGYTQRPQNFPLSIILCGVRDVRDYRIQTTGQDIITGGSAFNIKAESLRLGHFIESEVQALLQQHTNLTGQVFTPEALTYIWQQTQGQPWLINALAYQVCFKGEGKNRTQPITLELMKTARESLIQRRDTHLDQLTDKLKEPRVHRVISTLLEGMGSANSLNPLDTEYVKDLGLITVAINGETQMANPIYQEVIPRELVWGWQMGITQREQWYQMSDQRLDIPKLLRAFQQFFHENSEVWIERFDYKEAGPQLLLQAFLQRILNGDGRLTREYGLGRKRTDLLIEWPLEQDQGFLGPVQRVVLELKILHRSLEAALANGLPQTADYADKSDAEEAHLICFNRDPQINWDDKIFEQIESYQERTIHIWGM
ncbi:hypothetical protein Lepto7375DRAFT_5862 [Leptolyngbya sp. PCC 7375]|nr:hypothetical protein Lepto7375DRAFT_5862 [Leptolyngbya sp. PCC 7375]